LRREWPWWLAALLGVAVISYVGLQGFARSDYSRESAPAFQALLHGDVLGFFALVPAYGGSLILRAPFAGAVALLGGDELAVYRAVSIPCLLAVALLGLVVVRRMRARGATTAERGLVLALFVVNPVTVRALYIGHPEELLCAALAIGAVIAAADRRALMAGVLLGLAIATKAWAVLAIGPVLLALPARRLLALAVAGALAAVVLAPIALLAPTATTTLVHAARQTGAVFNPWQVWWMLGDGGHTVPAIADGHLLSGYRFAPTWLSPLTHPLIATLMIPLSLVWLRARGAAPRVRGEQLLGLLALLLLLRCALDPWNCVYYELPFLFTLLAWEALARPDHEPVLTFALCAVIWVTFEVLPGLASPDVQSVVFLAWAVALGGWLARELFAPRDLALRPGVQVGDVLRVSPAQETRHA
jgi:hypothetical protein